MSNFKVIVIGGGPVGLVAAHALSKAGIDFVVLEGRPQIAEDVGASLVLISHNIRVLAQLGMLDQLRDKGHEVMRWAEYNDKGCYALQWHSETMRKNHGYPSMMFHRAELVQLFYDCLGEEDKARVHVNKRMADIESTADGVVVTCTDGSKYEGSIVLGADGVHSKTRGILRQQALKADPTADVDKEFPFPCEYKTLWCSFPRRYEFTPGDHHITHGNIASLQFINSSRRAWVFVYEKLDKQTTERSRYTEADMEAFAAKHGDMKLGNRLRLKDVFKYRTAAGMTNLEEGMLKHWSHGRIVLAGDSCHKYTPNAGQGLNNGIQDLCALVNELRHVVHAAGPLPSEAELAGVFTRYQESRVAITKKELQLSAHTTRLCAWPNTWYWLVDQYVLPNIPFGSYLQMNYLVAPTVSSGFCLDFLEGDEPFMGAVPWKHPIPKPKSS